VNARKQYGKWKYLNTSTIVKLQNIMKNGNAPKRASRDGFASGNPLKKSASVRNETLKKITVFQLGQMKLITASGLHAIKCVSIATETFLVCPRN